MKTKTERINKLGLLGVVSLLSYTAAVIFSPLAYPGYDWMSQAVSDLSAANAPSLGLWNQLSSLYEICGIVSVTLVLIFIQGRMNRTLRTGIYLFTSMQWISAVGFSMFPLSDSGYSEAAQDMGDAMSLMFSGPFQDIMHMVVTILVIVLSVIVLIVIIVGGFRKRRYVSLAVWASAALLMMFIGPLGMAVAPKDYAGLFERFGVFAATGFNAVLGVYLFSGFKAYKEAA